MSSTPSSAISAQEYAKVKEEVTFAYTTYASVLYPALSKANNHADCLIHAALLGDSTVFNLFSDTIHFILMFCFGRLDFKILSTTFSVIRHSLILFSKSVAALRRWLPMPKLGERLLLCQPVTVLSELSLREFMRSELLHSLLPLLPVLSTLLVILML